MTQENINEHEQIVQVIDRLSTAESLPREVVADVVGTVHSELAANPIRNYIPLLVERRAKQRLAERH